METLNFDEVLDRIVAQDPRYHRDAYHFLREALDHTQKMLGSPPKPNEIRHVSGQQLLEGVRECALKQFGPMAATVLEEWGVRRCEDFGEIVFNMIETHLLAKTARDSRDDFKGGYDFHEAFLKPYLPTPPAPKRSARPQDA